MPSKIPAAFDQAVTSMAVGGEVVMIGPSHLHGSLTPDAALATGERMIRAAEEAKHQTVADDQFNSEG